MNEILTIILGGGQGTRLFPLTKYRAKPAVPIGGKYRLIDITLSNCVHSGLRRVFVLTQFMSVSLNRHVAHTFAFDRFGQGFVDVIPASQSREVGDSWFQGTADAVRKSMLHFRQHSFRDYLILSGDHLYRMDYRDMWRAHFQSNADVTVGTVPVLEHRVSEFGIMKVDGNNRIRDFTEKPKDDSKIRDYRIAVGDDYRYLASMGIYIFRREVLNKLLNECSENDFGHNVVPYAIKTYNTHAYQFSGYWEDVGRIDDFFRANIELTSPHPAFTFYDPQWPIFTRPRTIAGSVLNGATVDHSIITEGCKVYNATVTRSILGIRSVIGEGSELYEVLVMGADYYEGEEYYPEFKDRKDLPSIGIGANCNISRAIIDKNARIGANVTIHSKTAEANSDHEGYYIRNGITVVEKNAVIPSNCTI